MAKLLAKKKKLQPKTTEETVFKPKSKEVAEKLSEEAKTSPKKTLKKLSKVTPEKKEIKHNESNSEPVRKMAIESDRLTYHFGRKLNDDDFGNTTIGITLSSSLKENETLSQLAERVIDFVEVKAMEKMAVITEVLAEQ